MTQWVGEAEVKSLVPHCASWEEHQPVWPWAICAVPARTRPRAPDLWEHSPRVPVINHFSVFYKVKNLGRVAIIRNQLDGTQLIINLQKLHSTNLMYLWSYPCVFG